ncbi:MAG: pyridoxamine 5'-phosphate oxidase family protein [Ferruginibacter sp.]|nr:pyridoxamine 5'-phosphate oxidase family protein [Ferruginibacter sp.]
MGKFHDSISLSHQEFIEKQHLFFVSTAPLSGEGHINLSPKGLDCFRVLSASRCAYMDLISSGNETSAHTLENGRITFMFCSFEGSPNILRLYGKGFTVLPGSKEWETYAPYFVIHPSTRQIIVAEISKIQTSCGFGVPLYTYEGERKIHFEWAEKKGKEGLEEYVKDNNLKSLDGLPTLLGLTKGNQ